ncbi:hypothetical protein EY06_15205, partial [Staphylococcus aureus]
GHILGGRVPGAGAAGPRAGDRAGYRVGVQRAAPGQCQRQLHQGGAAAAGSDFNQWESGAGKAAASRHVGDRAGGYPFQA